MNGYLRAIIAVPNGYLKLSVSKLFAKVKFGTLPRIDRLTEVSIDSGANCVIGKRFNMRRNAILRVRKGATITLGNNVSLGNNCIVACHDRIEIGDNVQFSPGVLLYDHDHDFRVIGGLSEGKFVSSPITIGNNVWIGANTIILKGTSIGNNCVIGAGSVIKGSYPDGSVVIQKRKTDIYT